MPIEWNRHHGSWVFTVVLSVTGSVDEAMVTPNGLVDAAEATGNPFVLSWALIAYGLAVHDADPVRSLVALRRGAGVKLPAGASTPTMLPFTDLTNDAAVAVDTAAIVYVTDSYKNRVLQLPAGATAPTQLPFTGVGFFADPAGLAVDTAGAVYLTDASNDRVLKLPAGAGTPTQLPFVGLSFPTGVAADTAGNVYVVDQNRVVKLPAG